MSWIATLKNRFFERKLRQARGNRPVVEAPQAVHPSSARTLAILFPADDASERQLVEKIKTERGKQGKKTQLLGYFSTKVTAEASYNFPFYSPQNLSWAGVPGGKEVAYFLTDSCDLLYVLGGPELSHFHYIAQVKKAGLRVGPFTFEGDPDNFYHVQYLPAKNQGLKARLEQINRLFNIINAKEATPV